MRTKALTYDTGIGQVDPNLARYLRGPAKFNEGGAADLSSSQQMVPVDPSFRDRLEMLLSDTLGLLRKGGVGRICLWGPLNSCPELTKGCFFQMLRKPQSKRLCNNRNVGRFRNFIHGSWISSRRRTQS